MIKKYHFLIKLAKDERQIPNIFVQAHFIKPSTLLNLVL